MKKANDSFLPNESILYLFFVRLARNKMCFLVCRRILLILLFFGVPQNSIVCAVRWKRVKTAALEEPLWVHTVRPRWEEQVLSRRSVSRGIWTLRASSYPFQSCYACNSGAMVKKVGCEVIRPLTTRVTSDKQLHWPVFPHLQNGNVRVGLRLKKVILAKHLEWIAGT